MFSNESFPIRMVWSLVKREKLKGGTFGLLQIPFSRSMVVTDESILSKLTI